MAAESTGAKRLRDLTADFQDGVGQRLRSERERQGISLRKLAGRLALSPSALSQIETGRSRPSVSTLYSIVSELGLSFDELFAPAAGRALGGARAARRPARGGEQIVQRADKRQGIELESGVRWERLNPIGERDVDFLEVVTTWAARPAAATPSCTTPGASTG